MDEFDLSDADAILAAAARGEILEGHEKIGDALVALHEPAAVAGSAPPLALGRRGVVGRVARRTAVAAGAAVLGVAGMAAAESGVVDALLPGGEPVVEEVVEESHDDEVDDGSVADREGGGEVSVGEDDEVGDAGTSGVDPAGDERDGDPDEHGPGDDGLAGDDRSEAGNGPAVDIEGIDTSDGVGDAELAIACDAVDNHGEYVRLVARDKITEHDGTHGSRVSDAARSDCGKDDVDDADESEDSGDEAGDGDDDADDGDDEAGDDDEADAADDGHPGNGKAKGHSESNGRGHGHGKGKGHAGDVTDSE